MVVKVELGAVRGGERGGDAGWPKGECQGKGDQNLKISPNPKFKTFGTHPKSENFRRNFHCGNSTRVPAGPEKQPAEVSSHPMSP